MSGYQIPLHAVPVQLHVPVTQCSNLTAALIDAEVNKLLIGGNKDNFLLRGELLQQTVSSPEKRRNSPPSNRIEPSQQVCRNCHFQMESISWLKTLLKRGLDFMTCIDLKRMHISPSMYTSPLKSTSVFNGETNHSPSRAFHLG